MAKHGILFSSDLKVISSFFVSVIQEEVFPSDPARGRLVQSELLQRREDLQRAQRNHLPGLLHGCGSGTL